MRQAMKTDLFLLPIREAALALKANRGPNLLSLISIALCVLMLGFFIIVWRNMLYLVELVRAEAEITVYLADSISPEQLGFIVTRLSSEPGVAAVEHVTREQALARMKEMLGVEAGLLEAFEGLNPFSAYLEVRVDPQKAGVIAPMVSAMSGVENVRENHEVLERLLALTRLAQWAGITLTIGTALVSVVVVSHIVRLGIHSRRDEIETLRLLGASEGFVKRPFLVEGAALGLGGALLAILFAVPAYRLTALALTGSLPFLPPVPSGNALAASSLSMAVLGFSCGILGSLIALRPAGDTGSVHAPKSPGHVG